MNNLFVIIAAAVAFLAGATLGGPKHCYHCENNSTCNDPIDAETAPKQRCWFTEEKEGALEGLEIVCVKATAMVEGQGLVTSRQCTVSQFFGKDICSFVKEDVEKRVNATDYKCSTCDTDLCNF